MLEQILRVMIRIGSAIELMVDDMIATDFRQTSPYRLLQGNTRDLREARIEIWGNPQC